MRPQSATRHSIMNYGWGLQSWSLSIDPILLVILILPYECTTKHPARLPKPAAPAAPAAPSRWLSLALCSFRCAAAMPLHTSGWAAVAE